MNVYHRFYLGLVLLAFSAGCVGGIQINKEERVNPGEGTVGTPIEGHGTSGEAGPHAGVPGSEGSSTGSSSPTTAATNPPGTSSSAVSSTSPSASSSTSPKQPSSPATPGASLPSTLILEGRILDPANE